MNPFIHHTSIIIPLGIAALVAGASPQQPARPAATPTTFVLTSADIPANGRIPDSHAFNGMGCTGKNTSPALAWKNPPAGTRSFVVTIYDPDAPTGSGWWHWVMYNIPASATSLAAGAGDPKATSAPPGSKEGNTDFGSPGYGGPCPPAGDKPHHYIFTVYALKVPTLDVPANATAAYVGFNVHANMLGKASFTALYGR